MHLRRHHAQAGSWAAAGGPDASSLGMHRLAEHTVVMGDTCSTAEKMKRLIADSAMESAKAKIGDAAWAAMTTEQQNENTQNSLG